MFKINHNRFNLILWYKSTDVRTYLVRYLDILEYLIEYSIIYFNKLDKHVTEKFDKNPLIIKLKFNKFWYKSNKKVKNNYKVKIYPYKS